MSPTHPTQASSFLGRNEFLIRRLHSLSGLIPVGAYMAIHLVVNASLLNGPGTYQRAVYQIHSLGKILPLVEWAFVFIPILFHGAIGVLIYFGGLRNTSAYPYVGNIRYALQRITGLVAFVFIVYHVFHTRGWLEFGGLEQRLGGANFRPYNAASSLGLAMQSMVAPTAYALGMLSCVFHLANGIWTMGITWGAWISPAAQRRASWVCLVLGVGLAVVGMGALVGSLTVDVGDALRTEDAMYHAKIASGVLKADDVEHKRWAPRERAGLDDASSAGAGDMDIRVGGQ